MAVKKATPKKAPPPEEAPVVLVKGTTELPVVYKKIILALEQTSTHAFAEAFRSAYPAPGALPPVSDHKTIDGVGVSGYIYGKFYLLGQDPSSKHDTLCCALFEDDKLIYHFKFS